MDDEHYQEIDRRRAHMDKLTAQLDRARDELHEAVRAAFPETTGGQPQRGVLAEVVRRSGLSREYVAQIRDGKVGQ